MEWYYERGYIFHRKCGGKLILKYISKYTAFSAIGGKLELIEGIVCECNKCGKEIYISGHDVHRIL